MKSLYAENRKALVRTLKGFDTPVSGRFGSDRRTTEQCEAWVFKKVVSACPDILGVGWPLKIIHGARPDFIVEGPVRNIGIEITEAAPPEDGRAWAILEEMTATNPERIVLNSELPLRHSGSPEADIELTRNYIEQAIRRKSRKLYVTERPTDLWIYPNSEASWWLTAESDEGRYWDRIAEVFRGPFSGQDKFRRVLVFFSSDNIWLSCLNQPSENLRLLTSP